METHARLEVELLVQVAPESAEVQMGPPCAAAASWEPSAEEAMDFQTKPLALVPAVRFVQVTPESAEIQISRRLVATRLRPSAEEAMALQPTPLALVPVVRFVQVAPESAEVQISPRGAASTPRDAVATSLEPSAELQMALHDWPLAAVPAVRFTQVTPESAEVQISARLTVAASFTPSAEEAMARQGRKPALVPAVRSVHNVPACGTAVLR